MSNTTVTIDPETAKILDRLSKANGVTKKEFMKEALLYFEKYGINPVAHESPAQEMQKLIKRFDQVFGFIRTQEKDLIRPMFEAVVSSEEQIKTKLGEVAKYNQLQTLDSYLRKLKDFTENQGKELYYVREGVQALSTKQEQGFKNLGSLIEEQGKTSIFGLKKK